MKLQAPIPVPGESCEDFCIRAHQHLLQSVPIANQRNQVVWDSWEMANPSPERYAANQKFSA
jgi:hypothetical protein